jgi:hypothetical protein
VSIEESDAAKAELAVLQREWRLEVTQGIKDLRNQNSAISQQLSELKRDFTHNSTTETLSQRVTGLESDRAKIVGAVTVVQLLGGAILWILNRK